MTASDDDTDDQLYYSIVSGPSWLSVDENGKLFGKPDDIDLGIHSVTVEVTDSQGASDQKTFSLKVNSTNDLASYRGC